MGPRSLKSVVQLFGIIDRLGRRQLIWLVLLTVGGSITELVTIGAVVPFISLLAAVPSNHDFPLFERLFRAFGAEGRDAELLIATTVLCAGAVASSCLRLMLLWKTQDFVSDAGQRLSVEVQGRMLQQPYSWHVRKNSSEQLAAIAKVDLLVNGVLASMVQALAAGVLLFLVVLLLLKIAPFEAVAAGVVLGAAYYLSGMVSRRRLERYSQLIGASYKERILIIQEGLGAIREIILDNSQARVLEKYRAINLELVRARSNAVIVGAAPRFLVEPAAIIIIAGLALLLSQQGGGLLGALPILAALAVGGQRLLPLVNQLYQSWSNFTSNRGVINDVLQILSLPYDHVPPRPKPLTFLESIEFRRVSYIYPGRATPAVDELNFTIKRGSRTALVGPTGSGKSTSADLLMGLLQPSSGAILVDGVELADFSLQPWRANVAHVPQLLFVADASIAQNIALSENVDIRKVREAAAIAQLSSFVASLPRGYDTLVGEKGVQISGGQRQRLAIARAVYRGSPLLVFDEATSALDSESEAAVLEGLDGLQAQGRTIVMIGHSATVTRSCDQVIRLEEGRLASSGLTDSAICPPSRLSG